MSDSKIISVVTSVLGYRVIVDYRSFLHAQKHFFLPPGVRQVLVGGD